MCLPAYNLEFPDFDLPSGVVIPPSFVDTSWHNDSFPSWVDAARGLYLCVDYPDYLLSDYPDSRQNGTLKVFTLSIWMDPEQHSNEIGESLIESNNWQDILDFIAHFSIH